MFAEAFPEKKGAESTPIKLWGVTIDPQAGKAVDARVSVVLMKFLRARCDLMKNEYIIHHSLDRETFARNLSVPDARSKLVSTLQWRDSFKPEEATKEAFPPDIFGQLGHVYGKDKDERPVTYVGLYVWPFDINFQREGLT